MTASGSLGASITRERVHACARGGTYKYFVPAADVEAVWQKLEAVYGLRVRNPQMKTIQVESTCFIFRSTFLANPLTVIRKRACTDAAVAAMHQLLGYAEPGAVVAPVAADAVEVVAPVVPVDVS